MRILYDDRIGLYDVPKAARCRECGKKLGEADRDKRLMSVRLRCPKCFHEFDISFAHPSMFQQMRAPHDANGNPRRCWAVYDQMGALADVIDEGYKGTPLLLRRDDLVQLPTVEISASEYRDWIKAGEIATGYREAE